jgi:hypothetical protein
MGKPWKPGESGNPKGRPSGITLGGRLREAVGKEFDAILAALISQAKAGEMQAASLLLHRVVPAIKPVQEPVKVDISGDTLTQKAGAILDAVGHGKLSPSDAKLLLDGLGQVSRIIELDDLVRRVEALEGRQP